MAKSPKKSPTRTRTSRKASLPKARKPNKKLRELMRHKPVWEQPPLAPPPILTSAANGSRGPSNAVCAYCGMVAGKPDCPTLAKNFGRSTAAQAENDKLVQQPGAKPSNPKDVLGILKVPMSTIPLPVLSELGVAMLEGALKYGRHNYRAIGVRASVYFDAEVARHLTLWWEGEDLDPDSGLSHITKAIASLVVMRDAMIQGKLIDDRPPPSPAGWQNELNAKVKALVAKYPNPVAPYVKDDPRMK